MFFRFIVFLLLIPSLILNFLLLLPKKPNPSNPDYATYRIIDIIDGDTIVTDKSQKIRLLSVDAPDKNLCGYQQAKDLLTSLVLDKNVTLSEIISDKYNRIVALVHIDDLLVNQK